MVRRKKKAPRVFPRNLAADYIHANQRDFINKSDPVYPHTARGRQEALKSVAKGVPIPNLRAYAGVVMNVAGIQSIDGQTLRGNAPRVEAVEKMWQGWNRQGFTGYTHIELLCTKSYRLQLFFAVNEWFFLRTCFQTRSCKRSVVYLSKENAMRAFNRGMNGITWTEEFDLPATEP